MAGLVLRRQVDIQSHDSWLELQLFDGHVGADEGIVVQDEQVGVGEAAEEGPLEVANDRSGEMCVGGVGFADLVPNEFGVGSARVLLGVGSSVDLGGGVADFGDAVDGVLEGLRVISWRRAHGGKQRPREA